MHVLVVLTSAARQNGPSVAAEAKRDPVYPVHRALPPNKTQHERALEVDAIGQLLRDMACHGGRHDTLAAFRLMWLTLCRPLEAVEARWSEVDLDAALWRMPVERTKQRKPHAVPLPRQALHGRGWSGKYSPHATRTTGSTRLNEMGYRPDWIERQLAHQEPNSVRRTYNHAEHFADRVAMMQRWADLLDACEKAVSEGKPAAIAGKQPQAGDDSA